MVHWSAVKCIGCPICQTSWMGSYCALGPLTPAQPKVCSPSLSSREKEQWGGEQEAAQLRAGTRGTRPQRLDPNCKEELSHQPPRLCACSLNRG